MRRVSLQIAGKIDNIDGFEWAFLKKTNEYMITYICKSFL